MNDKKLIDPKSTYKQNQELYYLKMGVANPAKKK